MKLHGQEIRPTIGLCLNFDTVRGPIASRLDFVARKTSRFWSVVKRYPIDPKFDREPRGIILRWSISANLRIMVPRGFVVKKLDLVNERPKLGQMMLKWPETWFVAIWKYFETIHVICLKNDDFGSLRHLETWFCCLKIDVRSNDVRLAWNFK